MCGELGGVWRASGAVRVARYCFGSAGFLTKLETNTRLVEIAGCVEEME